MEDHLLAFTMIRMILDDNMQIRDVFYNHFVLIFPHMFGKLGTWSQLLIILILISLALKITLFCNLSNFLVKCYQISFI